MGNYSQNLTAKVIPQPPYTNRGVTLSNCAINDQNKGSHSLLLNSFFDWYGATIRGVTPESFLNCSRQFLIGDVRQCRPINSSYASAYEMYLGEDVIFKCSYGGCHDSIYVVATSQNAQMFSEFLRDEFKEHTVSRVDIANDYDEESIFDSLCQMGFYLAEKYSLKINQQGDWHTGKGGRTLYIGSRQSVSYLRIYEKGKEQIQKGIDANASKDWVRMELEVKPGNKLAKYMASRMSPIEFFSASAWTREIGDLLGEKGLRSIPLGTVRNKTSDLERKMYFMLYQYGNLIEDIVSGPLGGRRELLGKYLEDNMVKAKNAVEASRSV